MRVFFLTHTVYTSLLTIVHTWGSIDDWKLLHRLNFSLQYGCTKTYGQEWPLCNFLNSATTEMILTSLESLKYWQLNLFTSLFSIVHTCGSIDWKKESYYTVRGAKINHGHDYTSCATHFDVEFWCGTCRYGTHIQCSVRSFIVWAAHFGARMLKVRLTGEGGTPQRLKIWLFHGATVDEMDWNLHGTIPAPWPIISTRFHSLSPPVLYATM